MTEAAASEPSRGRAAGFALRGPLRLLSDERLSRRACDGDRAAFEEIFRRYQQDLYRFCLATASNPQDAQEALQNTMVKVMRALPGEQREIKLKPWLFRIARNEAVETMRKRRDTVELGTDWFAAPGEISEEAGARERLRELFADLGELPERQRSTLVMRELAGLEFEEIGAAFGTSAAVARQTLYEARQSLRQMDEGREMSCETIRQAISDADGRVTRRRDIRAHLRDCGGCRAFRDDIARRRADFAAIAPLPLALATGLLQGVLGGAGGSAAAGGVAAGGAAAGSAAGGGLTATVGTGAGLAGSAVVKSAATVVVAAAVGLGAADRGGLIDLPTPPGGKGSDGPSASPSSPPTPGERAQHATPPRVKEGGRAAGRSGEPSQGAPAAARRVDANSTGRGAATGPRRAANESGRSRRPGSGVGTAGRPEHARSPADRPAPAAPPGGNGKTDAAQGAPETTPSRKPTEPAPSSEPSVPAPPQQPVLPPQAKKPPKAEEAAPAVPPVEAAPPATAPREQGASPPAAPPAEGSTP
jgi:RNA polymerase sigma factor (sigma-70 family)